MITGRFEPMRAALAFSIIFWALMGRGDDSSLVRIGEKWRYYKSQGGSMPPRNWAQPGFDDSKWQLDASGFEFRDEKSPELSSRSGRVFIRRRFTIVHPQEIHALLLRVEHEEGFVAYLNGREVARQGAKGVLRGLAADLLVISQIDLSRFRSLLVTGENVLALEGEQTGYSPSAFSLAAALLANFIRGPFVQNTSANGTQIIWRTLHPATTVFRYGRSQTLDLGFTNLTLRTTHVVTLRNLEPDRLYYYQAGSVMNGALITADLSQFRTFKEHGPVSFVVVGDTGQETVAQAEIAGVMRQENPDLVLHGGDIVYGGFSDLTVDMRFFNYYQPQMRTTPFFLTAGNHELITSDGRADVNPTNWFMTATNFQNAFYLPTNSVTGTEHFYSFDHGDAHFVALYNPWFHNYVFTNTSDQYRWLTNDLAHSRKPWKVAFLHSPIAHSGSHALYDNNRNGILDQTEMMDLLLPVAEKYGVDMIFGSHDHNFERFAPTNGLHHVVTGGGGASLYIPVGRHPASAQFWQINHCLKVKVEGETLTLAALGTDGAAFDSMVVHRTPTPRRIYQASWNSPLIESNRANDGDGNISGQKFNLKGEGLLTRAGRFSNLGRAYINNDATNLYVGFAQTMIYADNDIFLLVQSGRGPGVTTLKGLGNGILDADKEGVDGLDFLENLSFTNFSPGVACILGDEFADGQFRSFLRPGSTLNAGQGVFRLNKKLEDVPGIRLQQFNRSPQTGEGRGEQNADFIEVSIPLAELGNIHPGDVIKVGAVVAAGPASIADQTRFIDRSVLGVALHGEGRAGVVLEPIEVRLAEPGNL